MKRRIMYFSLVALVFALGSAARASAATYLPETVTSSLTLVASSSPYIVDGVVTIDSGGTMIVEPDVVVKFTGLSSLVVNGALDVRGTATGTVYFTSYKDDSVGGDTNGDGDSTSPAAGNWRHIKVSQGASTTINYAAVSYGGTFSCCGGNSYANLYGYGGTLNLLNSVISSSTSYGVVIASGTVTIASSTISNTSAYGVFRDAGGVTSTLTLTNNTFSNHGNGVASLNYDGGFTFIHSGNSATSTGYRGFVLDGEISTNQTWTADIPYIVSVVTVASGTTLTVDPGAVVKFYAITSYLSVSGGLNVQGTATSSVYFTSLKDDSIFGDTNNDATSTQPATSNWKTIQLNSGASTTLNYAVIRYGGWNSFANLYMNGGYLTVYKSTVASGSIYGIQSNAGTSTINSSVISDNPWGVYISGGTVTISSSTFQGNTSYGIYQDAAPTTTAENNYWVGGATSGPYHATLNSGGTGNTVTNYVDFFPWATPDNHYVVGSWSVNNREIRWNGTTTYSTAWDAGISTWNNEAEINIASATTSPVDLTVSDGYDTSTPWWGWYTYYSTTTDTITMNSHYLGQASTSSDQIKNVATHELGHALGLEHSFSGNIMNANVTGQTILGNQDISDYHYLWNN